MSKPTVILGMAVIVILAVFLYARYHKQPSDSAPVVPNTRLGPILPVRLSVGAKAAAIDQSNLAALGHAVQAYARKHGTVLTTLNALLQDPDHLVWLN